MRRKTLDQKATTLSYTDNKRISSARYGAGAVATTTTTTLWQSLSSGENCSNDYILHQRPLTENNENKNGHISQFPPHSFVFCCCQALATPAALLGIGVWSGRVFFLSTPTWIKRISQKKEMSYATKISSIDVNLFPFSDRKWKFKQRAAKCEEDSFQTLLISSSYITSVVDGRESRGPSSLFIRGDTAIFCAALTITLLLFELPDSDYSMIHSIIHTLYIDLDQFTNYRVNVFLPNQVNIYNIKFSFCASHMKRSFPYLIYCTFY